jgi:site-specific DNA-methyltransferase (adenine-specific)
MRKLVAAVLPMDKGVVLDPFMGSGATLAAASFLGLKSIGLEANAEYFQLATKAVDLLTKLQCIDRMRS